MKKNEPAGGLVSKIFGIASIVLMHLLLATFGAGAEKTPCGIKITPSGKSLGAKSNPIKCDMEKGELDYLNRLSDLSGKPVQFRRIGHAHPDCKGHILDKFEINAWDGSVCAEIYMDMYWPGHIETNPIQGFEIANPKMKKKKRKTTPSVKYKFETQALTAHDVYRMIIEKGFYCKIVTGSSFHGEALKNIKTPKSSIFRDTRIVTTVKDGDGLIKTQSSNQSKKKNGEKIVLRWSPQINKCSFNEVIVTIDHLNKNSKYKNGIWRIPTIMELFSIIEEKPKNHFPSAFKFPKNESLVFWTSTEVKKAGTVLEYDKGSKAYFVVKSTYNKTRGEYSLNFSFLNIEGKYRKKALLLPVLSGRIYNYQPTIPLPTSPPPTYSTPDNNRIPGFDDYATPSSSGKSKTSLPGKKSKSSIKKSKIQGIEDKIPGFDDIPDPSKSSSPGNKPKPPSTTKSIQSPKAAEKDQIFGFDSVQKSNKKSSSPAKPEKPPGTIKIALIPYMWKGMADSQQEDLLNNLNDKISRELYRLGTQIKKDMGISLNIDKKDSFDPSQINEIMKFYNIFSDPNPGKDEKLKKIKSEIIAPQDIDIIVTVKYIEDINTKIENFKPIIIDYFKNEIHSKTFIQNYKSPDFSELKRYIVDTISDTIYKKFKRR